MGWLQQMSTVRKENAKPHATQKNGDRDNKNNNSNLWTLSPVKQQQEKDIFRILENHQTISINNLMIIQNFRFLT